MKKKNNGENNMNAFTNPDVSVIMPTYNVEKYIDQCLSSLLEQSYKNFEVICVDDGSSDKTVSIIEEYIQKDQRIRLIKMPHCGKAGVMRNHGIQEAKGKYCLFLDGDDFFESDLIGHTFSKAQMDDADICLFDARIYSEKTQMYKEPDYMLKREYIPETLPYEGKSFPYVLNISTGCPWTKLYRKSFITENNLEFMPLQRSNDLYFVSVAMVLAKRITILEEKLVNYRQSGVSLQSNNASTPWDWYHALLAIRDTLKENGFYQDVELSFKNFVFGNSLYNMTSMKTAESFSEVYKKMKAEILKEFGLEDFQESECYSYNRQKYNLYLSMKENDVQTYLFQELMKLKEEKIYWLTRAKKAELNEKNAVRKVKETTTFKTGKAVLALPHFMKNLKKRK